MTQTNQNQPPQVHRPNGEIAPLPNQQERKPLFFTPEAQAIAAKAEPTLVATSDAASAKSSLPNKVSKRASTATVNVEESKAQLPNFAPNVDAIKSTIPDKVSKEPGKKMSVDPTQDDVWGQLAKHYEAMASRYAPESAEDAAKRERREKLASVMAGINDVGRAFANMVTTSKGGIHAFDANKDSATPRVQAMIDKATAQRQGKEGLYNQYMALRAEALGQGEKQKLQEREAAQKAAYQQMQLQIQLAEQARKEREAALNEKLKNTQINEAQWKARIAQSDAEYAGALAQAELLYKQAQRSKAMAEAYKASQKDKYELNVWDETNNRIKTLTFDTKEDRNKAAWEYTIAMGLDTTYMLKDGQNGLHKEHLKDADQLAGQVENASMKRKKEYDKAAEFEQYKVNDTTPSLKQTNQVNQQRNWNKTQ